VLEDEGWVGGTNLGKRHIAAIRAYGPPTRIPTG
jgi:hypothetical protein